jgi:hypothetical protein
MPAFPTGVYDPTKDPTSPQYSDPNFQSKAGWSGKWESSGWTPYEMLKDTFSTQDANAPAINPADYQYGGDAVLRDRTLAYLSDQGQSNAEELTGIGYRNYDKSLAASKALGLGAEKALDNANSNQWIAQAQVRKATGLSDQANEAMGDVPSTYGDQATQSRWNTATSKLGAYSPSILSQDAAHALATFKGGDVDARLGSSYDALRNYADRGPGPSAAQAQLEQTLDQNVATQIALAKSGRGAGASGNAMRQAQFQAANMGQQTAGQMATLRAQEEANWRQQQLQGLSAAGGVASNLEQSAQGRLGLNLTGLQSGLQGYSTQDAARLQAQQAAAGQYGTMYGSQASAQQAAEAMRQGYLSQSIGAQQNAAAQGQAASQLSQSGWDSYQAGLGRVADLTNQQGQNYLGAVQAGQASVAGYDQAALSLQENEANRRAGLAGKKLTADTEASLANQQADMSSDKGITGMLSAGLGALALSDERQKVDIEPYQALEMAKHTPGYSYEYKDPTLEGAAPGRQFGLMTKDLKRTPAGRSVVREGRDGIERVDTGRLAMQNTVAIGELVKKLDSLEELRRMAG